MRSILSIITVMVCLTACDSSYAPRSKEARYDPAEGTLEKPYPCPDWSQPQTANYSNNVHSNFGCATNTNMAAQLAYPHDLYEGHGEEGSDTESTVRVIERYRAGELPVPLEPIQTGVVAP